MKVSTAVCMRQVKLRILLNICAFLCTVSLSIINDNYIIFIKKFIIYAARAVFASCASTHSYDGCSEPENISVIAGENIHFNASIIHRLGGNCGFKQTISHVELRNCSNIDCTSWSTLTGNDRISATMSPDTERRFILSNSTIEDSGVYQVVARGNNPQTGAQSYTSITKIYWVTVQGEH